VENQLATIRDAIAQMGEITVPCAELNTLCPDAVLPSGKWSAIAVVAMSEHWSFTLHPNGDVCFAALQGVADKAA
jgi:hypothetical protein